MLTYRLKIGDYGLSKLMSADPVASQTVTVGTVHYMAPEIGAGKYDKSIDLYALGCLLYEMLTGNVPYQGASPTEVLMKHLQAQPNLDGVPEHFARVIRKALQKDPADRYASATEMVEDLFGAEHVRNSVSQLNANELSSIAQRVGRKLDEAPDRDRASPPPPAAPDLRPHATAPVTGHRVQRWPADPRQAVLLLAVVVAALVSLLTLGSANGNPLPHFTYVLALGLTSAWAGTRMQVRGYRGRTLRENLMRRELPIAVVFGVSSLIAFILEVSRLPGPFDYHSFLGGCGWAVLMPFVNWPSLTHPERKRGFSLKLWLTLPAVAALIGAWIAPEMSLILAGVALIAAAGAQLLSPPNVAEAAPPRRPPPPAAPRPAALHAHPPAHPHPVPDAAGAPPDPSSHHSRLAALLLCAAFCVLPLGGLHRFYTGRWLTGILWLCTGGLMGIGQLVDGILIVAGAFKDADEQPVHHWTFGPKRPAIAQRRTWTPAIGGQSNPFAVALHLTGVLLMVIGVAAALPVLLWIPEIVHQAPVFGGLQSGVAHQLGYDAWPRLVGRLLQVSSLCLVVLSTLMIAAARRGSLHHAARGVAAGGVLFAWIATATQDLNLRMIGRGDASRIIDGPATVAPNGFITTLDLTLQGLLAASPGLLLGLGGIGTALLFLLIPARVIAKTSPSTEGQP